MGIILIRNDRFTSSSTNSFSSSRSILSHHSRTEQPPLPDFLMLIGPSASIFSHCLTSHHPCQNIQRCESDEQCSDDVTDADDAPSDKRERVGHDFSFLFPSATGIIYPQKKAEVFIHLDKVFHVGCCCCVCVSKRIPPGLTDRWRRN